MPTVRMIRPELQKANDSQPLEWSVSYSLGMSMEKCLYSRPEGTTYIALPGARLPQPGRRERGLKKDVDQMKKKPGPPPSIDWLFSNGSMPKVEFSFFTPLFTPSY